MALFEMHYSSAALGMGVTVNVIIPDVLKSGEGPFKTLYLLHGLSGDQTHWLRYTSVERYAKDHGIAVVMPAVARSWYADTAYGAKYFTFITEELPTVCRGHFKGIGDRREDTFIGGLSMGGYGAIKAAMTYPERYAGCIALSGALDITRKGRPYSLEEWRGNFGFDLHTAEELADGENDIFALARRNAEAGKEMPPFFLWCGTEDTLLDVNRQYRDLLCELGIAHTYSESEGNHSWQWWDLHIKRGIEYFFAAEQ